MDDVVRVQGCHKLGTIFKFKGDMARPASSVMYPEPGARFGIVFAHSEGCSLIRRFTGTGRRVMEKTADTQEVEQVDVMNYNGEAVSVERKVRDELPVLHEASVSYDKTHDRVVIEFSAYARDQVTIFLRPHEAQKMVESLSQLGYLLESIEGYEWQGEAF